MTTYSISLNQATDTLLSYLEPGKIKILHRSGKATTWDQATKYEAVAGDTIKINYSLAVFDPKTFTWKSEEKTWVLTTDSIGGEGNNWILGSFNGPSVLSGLDGDDLLAGTAGNDYLNGGAGNDRLIGRNGNDTMLGGSGNDLYVFFNGSGADLIVDEGGTSDQLEFITNNGDFLGGLVTYRKGTSLFFRSYNSETTWDTSEIKNFLGKGYIENLRYIDGGGSAVFTLSKTATGSAGFDWISSTESGSYLSGLGGTDILMGYTGNDTLNGGVGGDSLIGLEGADKFVLDVIPKIAADADRIIDFVVAEDKIQLSKKAFKGFAATGPLDSNAYVEGAGKTAADSASQRVIYNTTTGDLFYDADGNGKTAAVKVAVVGTKADLSHTDFEIIA